MLTSFCVVALVGAISFVKENPSQNKDLHAEEQNWETGTWNFDDGIPNNTQYETCYTYEIYSATGLVNFLKTCGSEGEYKDFSGSAESGYYSRTVKLMNDIDCSNTPWPDNSWNSSFSGEFNGGGYTIKGIGNETDYSSNGDGLTRGSLFNTINGKIWSTAYGNTYSTSIKYLILENCYHSSTSTVGFGFLAMSVSGNVKINNVSVVNPTILDIWGSSLGSKRYYGGIVGNLDEDTQLTIEDCEVENLVVYSCAPDLTYASGLVARRKRASEQIDIDRCVVKDFKVRAITSNLGTPPDDSTRKNHSKLRDYLNAHSADSSEIKQYFHVYTEEGVSLEGLNLETFCSQPQTSIENFSDWGSYISTFDLDSTWFFDPAYNDGYPKISSRITDCKKYKIYYTQTYANIEQLGIHGYVQAYIGETATNEANNSDHIYLWLPDGLGVSVDSNAPDTLTSSAEKKFKAIGNVGYKFKEWATSGSSYTAIFEPIELTLTFEKVCEEDSSQEGSTPYTIVYGTALHVTKNVEDELSCTFNSEIYSCIPENGWYIDSVVGLVDKITKDTTITITIKKRKYSIDFDGDGGTWGDWMALAKTAGVDDDDIEITFGDVLEFDVQEDKIIITLNGKQKIFTPAEGYEINFLEIIQNGKSTKYYPGDFFPPITIKSDVQIIAHTKSSDDSSDDLEEKFKIYYDLQGGTAEQTYKSEYTVNELPLTLNYSPDRKGYTFIGWSGDYLEGNENSIIYIPTDATGDLTYTANWEIITYDIYYDLQGGTAEQTYKSEYTVNELPLTLKYSPDRDGYNFTGWTGSNGETPQLEVIIEQGTTGNLIYTANWTDLEVYTITYELDGGTENSNPTTYTIETDTFSLNDPTKDGYNFTGWTGSNGETPQTEVTIYKGTTGNLTYKANWEIESYTITYELDGGALPEGVTNPSTYTIETETFSLNNPTKTGYTFRGWTGSNGETPQLEVIIEQGTTGNLIYTANWTNANEYDIKYNNVEGCDFPDGENPETYNINTTTFMLKKPTKTGYTFLGWTGTDLEETTEIVTIIKGSTGDREYTAIWKANEVKLIFPTVSDIKMSDGSAVPSGVISVNATSFKYLVAYDSILEINQTGDAATGITITYIFVTYEGSQKTITYTISAGYLPDSKPFVPGNYQIQQNETTIPIKIIKDNDLFCYVRFYSPEWTSYPIEEIQVLQGTKIYYRLISSKAIFRVKNSNSAYDEYVFEKEGWVLQGVSTSFGSNDWLSLDNSFHNVAIADHTYFIMWFSCYYNVMFNPALDEFNNTDKATLTCGTNPIKILDNKTIDVELSTDKKTLTYKQEGKVIAKYTANKNCILQDQNNRTKIKVENNIIITPIVEYYACDVIIGKNDVNSKVKLFIDGVEQESCKIESVEFGTVVTFNVTQSNGLFTYTYTFKHGETIVAEVVYSIAEDNTYVMSSELTENGRVWHHELDGLEAAEEGYKFVKGIGLTYEISPTFELKSYGGQLS